MLARNKFPSYQSRNQHTFQIVFPREIASTIPSSNIGKMIHFNIIYICSSTQTFSIWWTDVQTFHVLLCIMVLINILCSVCVCVCVCVLSTHSTCVYYQNTLQCMCSVEILHEYAWILHSAWVLVCIYVYKYVCDQ